MSILFRILIPIWLLGLIFPPTIDTDQKDLLQVISAAWILPFGVFAGRANFLYAPVFRVSPATLFSFLSLVSFLTLCSLLSEDPLLSLAYTAVTGLVLLICAGFWQLTGPSMEDVLRVYALLGSALMAWVYWNAPEYTAVFQGRLSFSETSHPNHLGLIAFGMLVCCLTIRNPVLRPLLIALNLFAIAASQSRGSLLASAIAITLFTMVNWATDQSFRSRRTLVYAAVLIVLCIVVMVEFEQLGAWASELLLLDDRYRGLGTGFTGRLEAWEEAIDLFQGSPVFGVGFRMHERYMTSLSSAHNGYLSMLAETGVVGVLTALVVFGITIRRVAGFALRGDSTAALGIAFVVGYSFLAIFERYLINVGNPTSVLVWVFLFMPGAEPRLLPAKLDPASAYTYSQ